MKDPYFVYKQTKENLGEVKSAVSVNLYFPEDVICHLQRYYYSPLYRDKELDFMDGYEPGDTITKVDIQFDVEIHGELVTYNGWTGKKLSKYGIDAKCKKYYTTYFTGEIERVNDGTIFRYEDDEIDDDVNVFISKD